MNKLILKVFPVISVIMLFAVPAMAEGTAGGEKGFTFGKIGTIAVAAAAIAAAIGDSRAVSAACEGTARNPSAGGRIFTMVLLGLALIETLVLVTFGAAFLGL